MHKPTGLKLTAMIVGGLVAVCILIFGGFLLVGRFSRASDAEPRDVVVSSITQNSATVTWTTGSEVEGVVEYGTSPTSLGLFAVEGQSATSHNVDLTLLSPATTYYFQIKVGDESFTNAGVPWSFTTTSASGSTVVVPSATARPTVVPTAATPTQAATTPSGSSTCTETDCEAMKEKFGKGCTTQDYFACVRKLTPTPTP